MKYTRKPTEVEAIKIAWEMPKEFRDELCDCLAVNTVGWHIHTLEGPLQAQIGDYIIKGTSKDQGVHFWPVKPDYFEENYEEVK